MNQVTSVFQQKMASNIRIGGKKRVRIFLSETDHFWLTDFHTAQSLIVLKSSAKKKDKRDKRRMVKLSSRRKES